MRNLVIVDIGSNSVRMAINQINQDGTYREIKHVKSATRLSEGMGHRHLLQMNAINRTMRALKSFQNIYRQYHHLRVIGIATAAVRQAKNRNVFLERVRRKLGISIRVLSGTKEAYYDYLGLVHQIKLSRYIILDIGGASIEMIVVNHHQKKHLISLSMGSVTFSERFHLKDNVTAANLFQAQTFLNNVFNHIHWLRNAYHYQIILLGGTNRSLIRMNLSRTYHSSDYNNLNGYFLFHHRVFNTFNFLLQKNLEQRKQIRMLENARADIIVGGLLPLVTLMDLLDSRKVIFSDSGVREGIINEYVSKNK
ncbi:exopolyphosphatase [Philodulcilactobacillus myokoensis]|uniref:Exopolyphosphatase n=1 Tax=Philodulcilactobacillus myokoensis TaxID=2929573 RepID=A0A9W6B232_9LACO|nr:exopolyphosphatase [Philodulcilactobacillus myokoensis]GLB47238.1 exopolyphosphatase [Philodulcilactobacillus myokoensis]